MSSFLQSTGAVSIAGRDPSRHRCLLAAASQSFFARASPSRARLLPDRHRRRRALRATPSASLFPGRHRHADDDDDDDDDEDDDGGDGESLPPAEMNVLDRLALAWSILFPKKKTKKEEEEKKRNSEAFSPAQIAKQRLRMILISDRCAVNDSAKKKIVKNIVGALADFVEIEPRDRVRLNVCADPELGTVYSVSVPVRRVRHQFQEQEEEEEEEEGEEEEEEEEEEEIDGGGDDEAAEEKTSHQFTGGSLILNSSSSELNSSSSSSSS
jgi:septum formation topological specificity factor MinE